MFTLASSAWSPNRRNWLSKVKSLVASPLVFTNQVFGNRLRRDAVATVEAARVSHFPDKTTETQGARSSWLSIPCKSANIFRWMFPQHYELCSSVSEARPFVDPGDCAFPAQRSIALVEGRSSSLVGDCWHSPSDGVLDVLLQGQQYSG